MALGSAIDDRVGFRSRRTVRWSWRPPVWLVVSIIAVPALLWLFSTMRDPRFMPVSTVRVEGEFKHLTRAQLHAVIANYAVGGFFSVDVDAVRRAALRSPWVDGVSVRRVWPDTLRVAVTEQKPVARWGAAALLNDRGEVFAPPLDSFPPGLPQLAGPAGREAAVLERLNAINATLRPLHQGVLHLTLDERRSWSIVLSDGFELMLGQEDIMARVARYVAAYPQALAPHMDRASAVEHLGARARLPALRKIGAVDLRYTNGFAVRWIPSESGQ